MSESKAGFEYVSIHVDDYCNLELIASQLRRNVDEVLDLFFSGLIELRFSPDGSCGFTFKIDFE